MTESLRQQAMNIVRRLTDGGFEACLVGGCVRDEQLGRPVKDYDIATSAKPHQVMELFERTVPTGLQHGTVTVMVGRRPFEVTTFRREAEYEAFRRPSGVEYIDSLLEDLKRRDFTINAMAIDNEGKLIDPFGGRADLERGVLRCVGQAEERFREDALRMLRCLRFAAEYDLRVDGSTWESLMVCMPLLRHIAMERVRLELERMVSGSAPNKAIHLLCQSGALRHTKRELKLARVEEIRRLPDLKRLVREELRWAYLYLRIGISAVETAEDMKALTFSKHMIDEVKRTVAAADMLAQGLERLDPFLAEGEYGRRLWLRTALHYGRGTLQGIRQLILADASWFEARYSNVQASAALKLWADHGWDWIQAMPAADLSELSVTGQAVLDCLKVKAGPWTGKLLNRLLELVALGELPNETEALLQMAKREYVEMQEKESL
ncbi:MULTISPECIES: CCA tRNA nucleotidyltransferase [unclassified Paenibacillus]|uniref:CCA tRNA nucleotidyltransferase n=1 Tax=unclassified Paenibacillus TaxID=185978 RepID=UPI001AE3FBFA|nr:MULTISPECIES: CCA tRNA nucleotidyltransferase [unclassified Paenibacillus]MBP1155296.1 tRNA nucleotidyltransferase (CCA-adding enzyme) [Paenibacillus sp. PvP091]MBP1169320.1 tRNA nucleotidyltransferase (CCA-adding enzyme) [Paenibacillus sp. PvR098]MBP2440348.1 tRNA nucleotidyltransferase (CCA-adding enzyme) [Paenibacillus sp. PvP052]